MDAITADRDSLRARLQDLERENGRLREERDGLHGELKAVVDYAIDVIGVPVSRVVHKAAPLEIVRKLHQDLQYAASENLAFNVKVASEINEARKQRDQALAECEALTNAVILGPFEGKTAHDEIVSLRRENDRLRHGNTIEGDFVCPNELALSQALADAERMRGIEIRSFYIKDCADPWGARVWCAVTEGPNHATNERTKWTVYHRPNRGEMWPAKVIPGNSFDEALRVANDLAQAYRNESDHALSAGKEGGND
jgi:hypothetical protein